MRKRRQLASWVLAVGVAFGARGAGAAGLKSIDVPADAAGPAIKAMVWTPCAAAPQQVAIGPYTLPAVRDCAVAGDRLGLVVVSHGYGGNALGHHDTAEALADAGFVAVALNHPDDTTSNKDPAANVAALRHRPTDVKRVIDYMLNAWPDAAFLTPCPPVLIKEIPEICVDAGGFDRVAFHQRFDAEVVAFLRAHLGSAAKP